MSLKLVYRSLKLIESLDIQLTSDMQISCVNFCQSHPIEFGTQSVNSFML